MDQFILFGDSITQQSFSQEFGLLGLALSDAYLRKLDIVNRGFSGYNTSQALKLLPQFMPLPTHSKVRFMTVFFGANDARLPNTPGGPDQHVPLEQYKQNLRAIATHPCVKAHEEVRTILVTPPPVDERKLMQADEEKYGLGPMLRRTAAATAQYAQVVRDLGKELDLPVLDIWRAMVERAGYALHDVNMSEPPGSRNLPENEVLQEFLRDGLHFSRSAYRVLYEELMRLIEGTWPDQMPAKLSFAFPAWDDEQAWEEHEEYSAKTML